MNSISMIELTTAGRTDVYDYFRKSGIREAKRLNHTPFLVFLLNGNRVTVTIVDSIKELLDYPSETPVMAQWSGKWNSDYFRFTVADLKNYITANPKESYHQA